MGKFHLVVIRPLGGRMCLVVSLMVGCAPSCVQEVDADVLKRLSKELRQWNEKELALALLEFGGVETMGAAVELIIEDQ